MCDKEVAEYLAEELAGAMRRDQKVQEALAVERRGEMHFLIGFPRKSIFAKQPSVGWKNDAGPVVKGVGPSQIVDVF